MSAAEIDIVGFAAATHDVGMTRVRERVMQAPRALREDERRELAQHPELGAEIIRPLEDLGALRELILSHHERWDGSGYPRGIAGEDIPLGSRVLAVVDAIESMTSGRPYRPARRRDEAIAELRREAGRQFDPAVVEALARVLEREGAGS
jgi:HD-GYP domain-containing protein (c-di-GMP phosphodiesterase class II)